MDLVSTAAPETSYDPAGPGIIARIKPLVRLPASARDIDVFRAVLGDDAGQAFTDYLASGSVQLPKEMLEYVH